MTKIWFGSSVRKSAKRTDSDRALRSVGSARTKNIWFGGLTGHREQRIFGLAVILFLNSPS